jgi:tetratricopeptide (TPR) repeat protein/CHAT domain-containing protein
VWGHIGTTGTKKQAAVQTEQDREIERLRNILRKASRDRNQKTKRLSLNDLGSALHNRFRQLGQLNDVEEAKDCYQQALALCPLHHQDRSFCLNNLASVFQTRFQKLGELKNLEEAVLYHHQALSLRPLGHFARSVSLNNLANALRTRFRHVGDSKDLDNAILYHQQALILRPPGHRDRSMSLNNLALTLQTRFQQDGNISNLEHAIVYHRQALALRPPNHPSHSASLNNLANALQTRSQQVGEIKDLEEAITYYHQALTLRPPGHPERPASLNNLANALQLSFQNTGEINDLEEAITYYYQALTLRPPGHPEHSASLNNLANALQSRFEQIGRIKDLEGAITYYYQALTLRPPGHSEHPASLNNLANALQTKFQQIGEIKDLEEAILYHQQALTLRPPSHPAHPMSLKNLADAFCIRFLGMGNVSDIQCAEDFFKAAISCLPPYHPFGSKVLTSQASFQIAVHTSTWMKCQGCFHIHDACLLFESATNHLTSCLLERFKACQAWTHTAHTHGHSSAMTAYSKALELQQQHLALLPSMLSQKKMIENSATLALDAASCAISVGDLQTAIQFLEQGRSILWSKIQGYRQPLEELSEQEPELVDSFTTVCHQLEQNAVSDNVNIGLQCALSEKWTQLLQKIRNIEGFSGFLQAVPFSALQTAAAEGPIIMVNISEFQSDAIILSHSASPVVVALPDLPLATLKQLVETLSGVTDSNRPSKDVVAILRFLWDAVVQPVVNQLVCLQVPKKSRIWWCPTSYLCALPLHAAGPYKKGLKNLPDIYISSYTPTLTSLIQARSSIAKSQTLLKVFLVSQPDVTIPKVFQEIEIIKGFVEDITSCSGMDAHKEAVLAGLQSHPWVHFACHGHLEEESFDSWFQLHNSEHLTVLDLAKAQLPNAEFAFLSACHSAAGDIHGTPDESIHLAAALQFCGFKSVIGTLWAMVDDDGPDIADAFYKHMFCNTDTIDLRHAAEALNTATRDLRKKGVSLDRWTNFIHIGA